MTKLNSISLLLILVLSAQSQYRPEPPIRILTRRVSTPTFMEYFLKVFCTQCQYPSKFCNDNLNRISKISQAGNFKPSDIQKNVYGIQQANLSIGNVNVSCTFTNRILIERKMDFVLYTPISRSNALEGVVVYYHPTLFGIEQVPTLSTDQVNAIAGLYVTSAYAILFINYLGYGEFDKFPHPYVQYPICNVISSIIALNKALEKLKAEFPLIKKFKLFSAGYSQGAAYALWLERCLIRPEDCDNVKLDSAYDYQAAVAMEGPYDLITIVKPFLTNEVTRLPEIDNKYQVLTQVITNFGKAPLLAMTLISYMYFSLGVQNYGQKMNKEFLRMQCTHQSDQSMCKVDSQQYDNIYDAIKAKKYSLDIAESIAHSAFGKKFNNTPQVTFLGPSKFAYETFSTNSVYGLAQKSMMNSQLFNETIRNASAINNVPQKNVFLFSLKWDSVVSPSNTLNYIEAHKNTGKVSNYTFINSFYEVCTLNSHSRFSVDHNNGQLLANLFALSFIKNNTL